MSAGGAPAAMYLQFANPDSAFNLNYSVSVLAMSLIGGTAHWIGPVIGAIVLGVTQQLPGGDDFLRNQRARARRHAGAVRRGGAEGHHRPRQPLEAQGRRRMTAAAPEGPLLRIDALTKTFGGFVALDNINVEIRKGERFGLIGPNGSGKTTLVNCISRRAAAEQGRGAVRRRGHHAIAAEPALASRHCPQLSDSAAVPQHDRAREPDGGARLCRAPRICSRPRRTGATTRCRS